MKVFQTSYADGKWYDINSGNQNPDIVFCFGNKEVIIQDDIVQQVMSKYPDSIVVTASTAGEIHNSSIQDNTVVITGIEFKKGSHVVANNVNIEHFNDSYDAGVALAEQSNIDGLKLLFIISDGQLVNGGDLVNGLHSVIKQRVPVSGGLAGDGTNFCSTLVGLNNDLRNGNIIALGFYGDNLQVGVGSKGGWDKFGPMRTITKSEKNVLYEVDGENALDLYIKYLGEYSKQLPASALLFPIAILEEDDKEVVRTILSVDMENKSMTFAGNLPVGSKVRLMKANLDNLAAASADAAVLTGFTHNYEDDALALLISCVGRKLIFGNRIEEELDAARDIVGNDATITGFYSYGEIAPFSTFMKCELHNQTMTITTLSEI